MILRQTIAKFLFIFLSESTSKKMMRNLSLGIQQKFKFKYFCPEMSACGRIVISNDKNFIFSNLLNILSHGTFLTEIFVKNSRISNVKGLSLKKKLRKTACLQKTTLLFIK